MTGRFAPTPSGRMHLGNVLAALLAWLSARRQGGKILLRIEDLDLSRTSPAFTRQLMEDLRWLGLDWDEGPDKDGGHGPYLQSRRTPFYDKCIDTLRENGLVYPCFCSRAQLHQNAANAPHLGEGDYIYPGTCRGLSADEIAQRNAQKSPALRLLVPDETITFEDGCQGTVTQNLAQACGDFILRRSDGIYAYQLAAPADDGAMGVTEVVRGRDLLSSAPRQIFLLRTLGYAPPRFCHTPLLLAPDGRRLAKRDRDMDLEVLRAKLKNDPAPLLGKLAHLAGFLPEATPISAAELVPLFTWEKVRREDITIQDDLF